ncbi:MAG: hypothetical protein K0U86_14460 [Planctomycetes bacterium]|nr:hypothetical protein [Planctomycetota bacterium]MCH9726098.1 hypothetical protein [Planctomycetota bacterium]MCH9777250.1 hypothetical protein [Planctomycetota bacterium]MCH9791307.1 hypothetical protein [Planctomycetota bacterium]
MEWFAFLIYILIAALCTLVVWFTIKVGFRVSTLSEPVLAEPENFLTTDTGSSDQTPHLYWNFTATLIVIPTLILTLGFFAEITSLINPVTGTLAVALALIWGMAFWSGMLAFPKQSPLENQIPLPEFSEPTAKESSEVQHTIDPKETS